MEQQQPALAAPTDAYTLFTTTMETAAPQCHVDATGQNTDESRLQTRIGRLEFLCNLLAYVMECEQRLALLYSDGLAV